MVCRILKFPKWPRPSRDAKQPLKLRHGPNGQAVFLTPLRHQQEGQIFHAFESNIGFEWTLEHMLTKPIPRQIQMFGESAKQKLE